jgi:hypothetical protein
MADACDCDLFDLDKEGAWLSGVAELRNKALPASHSPDYLAGRAEALEEAEKVVESKSHFFHSEVYQLQLLLAIRALKETPR